MRLNGDSLFALQVHRVELLGATFPHRNSVSRLHQAIRKRGFPVVDMGYDGEISDQLGGHWQKKVSGGWARESRKFS